MNNKVLLIGEPILDVTIPLFTPERTTSLYGRAESTVFEQLHSTIRTLGGVLYWARFLHYFLSDNLTVLMPMPNGGHRHDYAVDLLKTLSKKKVNIHQVDVRRDLASILRCIEMDPSHQPITKQFPRSILRVDAGHSHRFNEDEIGRIANKLYNLNREWLSKGTSPKYIVLADYNLGLFTRSFLREINKIVDDDVSIIVYARRKWQKYADCFTNNNCTIIADANETIAELTDSEANLHEDEDIVENPIRCIRAKFPWIKQVVLVEKKKTIFAEWHKKNKIFELPNNKNSLYTPAGYRAVIAACLCIDDLINKPEDFLSKAHFAADYGGSILNGTFSDSDAKKIKSFSSPPKTLNQIKSSSIDFSPVDEFVCQFCCNGMRLELNKAITRVPGVFTADLKLKNDINDLVSRIENKSDVAISLFDISKQLFVQKILLQGGPGSGKTFLAEKIAAHVFQDVDAILNCNEIGANSQTVGDAAARIVDFISTKKGVAILNEINNMGNRGAEIQQSLLDKFENHNNKMIPVKDRTVVLLTASRLGEDMSRNDEMNNPDFYTRFPYRLEIPPLVNRHADPAYILAIRLFDKGINSLSLRFIASVVVKNFSDQRKLDEFIGHVIESIPAGVCKLDDDWFRTHAGRLSLSCAISIEPTHLVALVK